MEGTSLKDGMLIPKGELVSSITGLIPLVLGKVS